MTHLSINSLSLMDTEFLTDLSESKQWVVDSNIPQNELAPSSASHRCGYDVKNILDYGYMHQTPDFILEDNNRSNTINVHNVVHEADSYNKNSYYPTSAVRSCSYANDTVYSAFNINSNKVNNTSNQQINMNTNKATTGRMKKPKRVRTAFTTEQLILLEQEYARTKYLERNRRTELSHTLRLSERTVKVWFQNKRMKEKKDRAEEIEENEASSTTVPEGYTLQVINTNYEQNFSRPSQVLPQGQSWYAEHYYTPRVSSMYSTEMNLPLPNVNTTAYPSCYLGYNNAENFIRQQEQGETKLVTNDALCIKKLNEISLSADNIEHTPTNICLSDEDLELSWELINELSD